MKLLALYTTNYIFTLYLILFYIEFYNYKIVLYLHYVPINSLYIDFYIIFS